MFSLLMRASFLRFCRTLGLADERGQGIKAARFRVSHYAPVDVVPGPLPTASFGALDGSGTRSLRPLSQSARALWVLQLARDLAPNRRPLRRIALLRRTTYGIDEDFAGAGPRSDRYPPPRQCHSRPDDGRGRAGQVRPSRPADGHGGCRDGAVLAFPELRPDRSALAGPRPLRAVGRARFDAALFPALSDRLCRTEPGSD